MAHLHQKVEEDIFKFHKKIAKSNSKNVEQLKFKSNSSEFKMSPAHLHQESLCKRFCMLEYQNVFNLI